MPKERILITSALLYANGPMHFGHVAGAFLPADCYARFQRMQGNDVLFISGSDEYGVAITLSAELAGVAPQVHVDKYHEVNKELFKKFNISFDHYSRTTTPIHEPIVHAFFQDLFGNGYIEEQESDQLFSEVDGRFLADRYVMGTCPRCGYEAARGDECGKCGASYEAIDLKNPRSKLTGSQLIKKRTLHWILRFDRFKEKLETFLAARHWKPNVVNFAKQYVDGLLPRSITRDLEWGVPVPLERAANKVFYVWFDAPIGYISATQEWAQQRGTPAAWEEYWLNPETRYVQFLGKDNIPFHAVFFPAMIMGQNRPYKLVDDLVANEFYNLEGRQFSKSDGWTIDLDLFFQHFTVDQIRYVIAANAPETADSEFTWKDFQQRCNSDLVGKFGNFVNRVLVFIHDRVGGKIPVAGHLEEIDTEFLTTMQRLMTELYDHYSQYRLRKVAAIIMELAQAGNTYFDQKAPWKDVKEPTCHPRMETTLALCLQAAKYLALGSAPLMPDAAQSIWELLDQPGKVAQMNWQQELRDPFKAHKFPKSFLIFKKVEDNVIAEHMARLHMLNQIPTQQEEKKENAYPSLKGEISYEQFEHMDLRIGTVIEAQKVEKSKKLLKLTVDIGLETRTIVSGISLHYSPEELVGKKVIVLANLKPTKLMGIESQGMILAAHVGEELELVSVNTIAPGASVT